MGMLILIFSVLIYNYFILGFCFYISVLAFNEVVQVVDNITDLTFQMYNIDPDSGFLKIKDFFIAILL